MDIHEFGYNSYFETEKKRAGLGSFLIGRVVLEHRGSYRVIGERGEKIGLLRGNQMYHASSREDYPAVGDWVAVTDQDDEHVRIEGIVPRRSLLKRKQSGGSESQVIAANINAVFIVQAFGRDFSITRIERYAAMTYAGHAEPIVILNKYDIASKEEVSLSLRKVEERLPNVRIIATSVLREEDLRPLEDVLEKGKTYCFVGSSGVGKSSIINHLLTKEVLKTKETGVKTKRGKHATTVRMLFRLHNGAMVIDNPGMREFGLLDSKHGIEHVYTDVDVLSKSCKFSDCRHVNEKGCAVVNAVREGTLDKVQYESYVKLKKESDFYEMSNLNRRRKNRAFGKFVRKVKKGIEKYN